jgi:hypothetical protein
MIRADAFDPIDWAGDHWVLLAAVGGLLIAVLVLIGIAAARRKEHPDLEAGLREDLSEYPLPPPIAARQFRVNGTPARLRLVVVAPPGKHHDSVSPNDVATLLDDVVRGLGRFVAADKPRVKVWPPQLSVAGFAPTFHRLVKSPDASRWIKLAGPARTGKKPVLLGVAVLLDEPSRLGDVSLETTEWGELLEVDR